MGRSISYVRSLVGFLRGRRVLRNVAYIKEIVPDIDRREVGAFFLVLQELLFGERPISLLTD